jgi:large subunit ribosomal protein L7/L12
MVVGGGRLKAVESKVDTAAHLLRFAHQHNRIAMMPNCPFCNGTNSPGTTFCRSCGASIPESTTTTADLELEVRSLLEQGRKLEAVKVYKVHTGCGLKDAKDAVEALQRGASLPEPEQVGTELEAEVLNLLERGEKLRAVKLYRDRTGANLMESKLAVESVAARHGITVEGGGCSGVLIVSIVVLIAIAVVAALVILKQ